MNIQQEHCGYKDIEQLNYELIEARLVVQNFREEREVLRYSKKKGDEVQCSMVTYRYMASKMSSASLFQTINASIVLRKAYSFFSLI